MARASRPFALSRPCRGASFLTPAPRRPSGTMAGSSMRGSRSTTPTGSTAGPMACANLEALRAIFRLTERAQFEWIVSAGSLAEAADKRDAGHLQWLWDIADHSTVCFAADGPIKDREAFAARLAEPRFGYLSAKDRRLLVDALALRCE